MGNNGMKGYRFWYHYNKPLSKKMGKPIMTVHYRDKCYATEKIVCNAATETHRRKRQPFMVVRGWTKDISFFLTGSDGKRGIEIE
jgi:hypothetical protein